MPVIALVPVLVPVLVSVLVSVAYDCVNANAFAVACACACCLLPAACHMLPAACCRLWKRLLTVRIQSWPVVEKRTAPKWFKSVPFPQPAVAGCRKLY